MKTSASCRIRRVVLAQVVGLVALIGATTAGAATVHVSTAGNDASDGLTWATAKKTVQAGSDAAASGDQVWVAAGTYVQCITLKAGVALYGGFAGGETELGQRDWNAHVSILDGNRSGAVVTAWLGLTQTTRIDGFTIRNGTDKILGGMYTPDAVPYQAISPSPSPCEACVSSEVG